jgi:hypothetical protein
MRVLKSIGLSLLLAIVAFILTLMLINVWAVTTVHTDPYAPLGVVLYAPIVALATFILGVLLAYFLLFNKEM